MRDYIHNNNDDNFVGTVTFSGLQPNGFYELYVYGLGDQTNQFAQFAVDATSGGASGIVTGPSRNPIATPTNYLLLNAVATAAGSITYTWRENLSDGPNAHAAHNGVQLRQLAIPEPISVASWLFAGVAALTFALSRRRR